MTKSAKKKTTAQNSGSNIMLDIAGLTLIALSLIGLAGLFTSAVGAVGTVGLLIKKGMRILAGSGYVVFLLLLIPIGLKLMSRNRWQVNSRFWGLLVLFGSLQIFLHRNIPMSQSFPAGLAGQGGGVSGAALGYALKYGFGTVGTYIFLVLLILVGVALCTGASIKELAANSWLRIKTVAARLGNMIINFLFTEVDETRPHRGKTDRPAPEAGLTGNEDPLQLTGDFTPPVIEVARTGGAQNGRETDRIAPEELQPGMCQGHGESTEEQSEDIPAPRVNTATGGSEYHLPPLSLLAPVPARSDNQAGKDVNQRIKVLEQILDSFGIKARVTHVSVGPSITRYELQPPPGVKVSKIVGLADDIALGMASAGVRIEAPIPGKAAVGIEVPNGEIAAVALRELLEDKSFTGSTSRLTIALGKDIAGTAVTADLAKMPHLLIAGATGSGKSVCVNTLICSILYKATPDEVKFLMVDPKMVELANYNGIPHLVSPVVTNAKKAAGALRWAVREMESRYDMFAAAGVRDITRYNALFGEFEREPGQSPLPYIVVIIDELADLMMVAPADVEDAICRLAQMARAAGIHLVVATQRPSVDVITGLIKANIPSRLSFAVSSQTDSRTILDMGGAEKLLGKGDMLFYPVGAAKPVRVQGAYISDKDVENLVDFLKDQARPVYNEAVLEEQPGGEAVEMEESDELLPQAAKIFIESGTASISMLQRRLHIGYSRAARLVDIMERRGIVGGFEGSKPRAVLMTMEQYQQVFDSQAQVAEAKTAVS
ncbi:DNA translocase FtsK 4TM domain-containing protein [Desulfallas thermosapovorans]|uniref:S-DNA-T family DNA segregation ATPase FtsK/SpoIIIE n=1 Tax=Desulfallas thermosapovorans DSM 6562 TaxID=1121431 RepID=A0A5S4ZUZ2_9FIRM|nr:S-DNA-T family DNA segregation ATPase FtsK/SpoIIIE [Desulfallas thermosapovorans DSM 6562]